MVYSSKDVRGHWTPSLELLGIDSERGKSSLLTSFAYTALHDELPASSTELLLLQVSDEKDSNESKLEEDYSNIRPSEFVRCNINEIIGARMRYYVARRLAYKLRRGS